MVSQSGQLCVLCGTRLASRKGEHVWPLWYLRGEDRKGPGAFAWTHNGAPICDRAGSPIIAGQVRRRLKLPVCTVCNGLLEQRFESPTKDVLRRLFSLEGNVSLTSGDAGRVGEWFAKTLMLSAHPEAYYDHSAITATAIRLDVDELPPTGFYEWLTSSGLPPDGLSVWLHRTDPAAPGRSLYTVPLPRLTADAATVDFVEFSVALHGLCVTMVVHPGWPVEHPLEASGQAVRVLPAPSAAVDLGPLSVLGYRTVSWLRCYVALKPGVLGAISLPPLRASEEVFAYLPEVGDLVDEWSA